MSAVEGQQSRHRNAEDEGRAANAIPYTISVIIPTKNEEENVAPLIGRIARALNPVTTELIFADDSDDQTAAVIEAKRATEACRIELIHRPPEKRRGGLGGAVVEAMSVARARWVCVMDGDLQHPPELIAELVATAEASGAAVVIASRHTSGAGMDGFGLGRTLLSSAAARAARLAFPRRLRRVSDPMSGFFLVRRNAIDVGALRPRGFKILIEILARHPDLRVAEVPFVFGARYLGETKASLREGFVYGLQLLRLRAAAFRPGGSRFSGRAVTRLQEFPTPPIDEESLCGS
jgi:glycosyltransferase involved in cell wall biosynthesis